MIIRGQVISIRVQVTDCPLAANVRFSEQKLSKRELELAHLPPQIHAWPPLPQQQVNEVVIVAKPGNQALNVSITSSCPLQQETEQGFEES